MTVILRFAQWKIEILHVLHNLGVKKKKRKTVVVLKHTLRRSRFTLSRAYGTCLACQHFIPNLISFVNLLTVFCFSMLMPTLIHAEVKKKTLKNDYHFALREDNPRTPDMLFITPRNFHATREEILSAGKPIRSKNNFRVITMGRVPIWGINSLSTFIFSWLYGVCIILPEVYLTVHKWTCNESDFFGTPEFHSMFTQISS